MKFATLALIATVAAVQLDEGAEIDKKGKKHHKKDHKGHDGCITLDYAESAFDGAMDKAKGKIDLKEVYEILFDWHKDVHHKLHDD